MSCCGCRALRKGCSEDCTLRPCLQWIKSPQSQAHATIFLAKFYGRAGLINLINAGPSHLRTEIFKSLLYEACGRIINPVYGSVGLITSNNWARCQAAVKTVLEGGDINPNSFRGGDIRHVNKDTIVDRPIRTRNRSKRNRVVNDYDSLLAELDNHKFTITGWNRTKQHDLELERAQSHDGSFSAETDAQEPARWALVKPESVELELTLGFNAVIDLSDSE